MNFFTVPLAQAQPQQFSISFGATRYILKLRWNPVLTVWIMDISSQSGSPLANGIAVVAGADLVNQLTYLGFDGGLIAQRGGDPNQPPTYAGLGITDRIYYVPYEQEGQVPFTREI